MGHDLKGRLGMANGFKIVFRGLCRVLLDDLSVSLGLCWVAGEYCSTVALRAWDRRHLVAL